MKIIEQKNTITSGQINYSFHQENNYKLLTCNKPLNKADSSTNCWSASHCATSSFDHLRKSQSKVERKWLRQCFGKQSKLKLKFNTVENGEQPNEDYESTITSAIL